MCYSRAHKQQERSNLIADIEKVLKAWIRSTRTFAKPKPNPEQGSNFNSMKD